MHSNRKIVWLVVAGVVIVGALVLRVVNHTQEEAVAPAPPVPRAAEAPVIAPVRTKTAEPAAEAEVSPADATAADAEETVRQAEEAQKKEMEAAPAADPAPND